MAQHILLFLTRCSAWLTVQLMVHSQTTPPHNMLLYLIWLFNYKPLANCKSSGSWLEPQLRVFSAKASSKASSRGFPSRAACGAWDTPEPSSRRFPALTDASLCWCRLRWWWGRAWSVGQRFRALTFLSLSLSSRFPASCASCSHWKQFESQTTQCGRGSLDLDSATSVQTHRFRGLGCVSTGTWLCC